MSGAAPLAGRHIVVTRPHAQATGLVNGIQALGGTPLCYPLLTIAPAADPAPLDKASRNLDGYDFAVFISPNAVDYAWSAISKHGTWPARLQSLAVGQGTVKSLAALGIANCIAPTERFDSEALLALPPLAQDKVAGKRFVIFRGNGGRELLADTLRARGATVDCIPCYQRSGPPLSPHVLKDAWSKKALHALTVSSSEGLRHLIELLDRDDQAHLRNTPVFVPHARIAETASQCGLHKIILTAGADAGILAGLAAYNWHS